MLTRKITTSGNSAALTLPADVLELLGLRVGSQVTLELVGRALVIRSVEEVERRTKVEAAMDQAIDLDRNVLRRLAQ